MSTNLPWLFVLSKAHLCPVFASFDPINYPGRGLMRVVPGLVRRTQGRSAALMYGWGQRFNWAALAMEMAQRGVQDRDALVADALRFVSANYEEPSKLTS